MHGRNPRADRAFTWRATYFSSMAAYLTHQRKPRVNHTAYHAKPDRRELNALFHLYR